MNPFAPKPINWQEVEERLLELYDLTPLEILQLTPVEMIVMLWAKRNREESKGIDAEQSLKEALRAKALKKLSNEDKLELALRLTK